MNPVVLFQSDYLDRRRVDADFEQEYRAVEKAGFAIQLLDTEALDSGSLHKAIRWLPRLEQSTPTVFRGWMMRVAVYDDLYALLDQRGYKLVNTPAQYKHTHHLPESYSVIQGASPRSAWTTTGIDFDLESIMKLLEPFGDRPVIIKDYVKSQKHRWVEACFIPSASDPVAVECVTRAFIEHQDDDLVGGLVFREFVELEPLSDHSKSGMPLTKEFRLFCLDGKALYSSEYWEEGDYGQVDLPGGIFSDVIVKVQSRFFTMDVAQRRDGQWIIMELGDGQVAGLPERLAPETFYERLYQAFIKGIQSSRQKNQKIVVNQINVC